MTDTAKPTPGPYKLQISPTLPLSLWSDNASGVILEAKWRHGFPPQRDLPCEEAIANLHLTKEAFETYQETNLTPRQLMERVKELEAAQEGKCLVTVKWLKVLLDTWGADPGHDEADFIIRKELKEHLAKCGKGGV
jgi:hypothetical protein